MKALSDPYAIGLTLFSVVMIVGYFSSKWQAKYEREQGKGKGKEEMK